MTEEELAAIESLLKQQVHVYLSEDEWSRATVKAMLEKIPLLIAAVRGERQGREILVQAIENDILSLRIQANNWAQFYRGMGAQPEHSGSFAAAEHLKTAIKRIKA